MGATRELDDRPELGAGARPRGTQRVKVVLVERADRLARATNSPSGRAGATADGVDLTTDDNPTTVMVRQILGAASELDKSMTVAKLRAARLRLRQAAARRRTETPMGATI